MAFIDDLGLAGMTASTVPLGAPIQGFFGVVIQTKSNALVVVVDQSGRGVYGVQVQVEWVAGTPMSDVFVYVANRSYEKVYPEQINLKVTVSGNGFMTKIENYTIAADGFASMRIVLNRLPQPLVIYRRPYFLPLPVI